MGGQWASYWGTEALAAGQDIEYTLVPKGRFLDLQLVDGDPVATVDTDYLRRALVDQKIDVDAEVAATTARLQGLIKPDAALLLVAKQHDIPLVPPAASVSPKPDVERAALHAMDADALTELFALENKPGANMPYLGQISNQIRYARIESLLERILAQLTENHEVGKND